MHKKRAGKLINAAFAREDWEKARDIIIGELKRAPKDHWLLTRLSTTYYEQKKYEAALKHVDEAAKIKPDCPLVLWDLAGTLDALGKHQEAINTYMKIFDKPTQELVDGPCGEGFDWAHALLTDCVFRLGVCFERLGKKQEALEMFRYFLRLRPTEKGSAYSLDDAAKKIAQLTSQTEKLSEMKRVRETVLSR